MKTKHLLTGLVLPTLFAACTAEDVVSQQEVAKADLNNRPVVGNVTLNFGEAESRATIGDAAAGFNAIEFVKGEDGFGARIIDEYSGFTPSTGYELDHASRKYTLTTYASSNYKYVNAGGAAWSTDALMIEGNYMFYYPYNVKNLARTACEVVLPLKQTVKPNEKDGYRNPIKDLYEGENPAIVGYTFLSATDQDATVAPTLQHVFAYPQITLTNNYAVNETVNGNSVSVAEEITITKVILSSNGFKEKGSIDHTGLVAALRDFSVDAVAETNLTAIEAGKWTAKTKSGEYSAETDDIVDWASGVNDGKIEVTFEGGLTLAPEKSYSFHIVAPAAKYNSTNSNEITMQVYLSNDKMFDTSVSHELTNLTFAAGKRYPTEEYNFPTNGTPSVKENPGTLATVKFTEDDVIVPAKDPAELIDDITEFEAFLKGLNNNTLTIKEVADLTEVNEEGKFAFAKTSDGVAKMKLNAAVVELLKKYLNSGSVEFVSKMQVEDAENAVALNKMTFNAGLEVLDGDISADGITVAGGQVVTVKGGTLTVPTTSTSVLKNVVVEAGELVANRITFDKATASIQKVNGVATGVVGKVTLNEDCGVVNGNKVELAGGEIEIASEATMEVGRSITTLTQAGTITNKGTLWVRSEFNIAKGQVLSNEGKITFEGVAVLKNQGTINNYTDLVISENTGTINMKSEDATLNVGDGNGDVDNSVMAYVYVTTGDRDDQTVWYVYESDVNNAEADAVKWNDGYSINALKFKSAKFSMNQTIAAADYNNLGWIKTIAFEGGSLYVKGDHTVNVSNIKVSGDVAMTGWGTAEESTLTTTNVDDKGNSLGAIKVNMDKGSVLTVKNLTLNAGDSPTDIKFIGATTGDGENAKIVKENGVINKGTNGTVSNVTESDKI